MLQVLALRALRAKWPPRLANRLASRARPATRSAPQPVEIVVMVNTVMARGAFHVPQVATARAEGSVLEPAPTVPRESTLDLVVPSVRLAVLGMCLQLVQGGAALVAPVNTGRVLARAAIARPESTAEIMPTRDVRIADLTNTAGAARPRVGTALPARRGMALEQGATAVLLASTQLVEGRAPTALQAITAQLEPPPALRVRGAG